MDYNIKKTIEDMFKQSGLKTPDCWNYKENDKGFYFSEANSNKKRYSTLKECLYCQRIFASRKSIESKFCSAFCFNLNKDKYRIRLKCAWCNKDITRKLSDLKKSKSKLYFCNKICKDKAQSIDRGLKELQLEHYKEGASNYLVRALKKYGQKCANCNITFKPFLEVHHKDSDRKNGKIENLIVVCFIHHYMRHMKYNNECKKWEIDFKELTSEEDLQNLLRISIE